MSRIVSVWLPAWPLERLERAAPGSVPAEQPFALVEPGARGVVLTAVTAAAVSAGLHVEMTLADARAVCPGLRTRPVEREADRAGLLRFARWCVRYAPSRNVDGDDGLWIDISGAAHLLGGEEALARDLVGRAARQGLSVRIGIADTHGAARALARYGVGGGDRPFVIAEPGIAGTDRVLAALPVAALGIDGGTVLSLCRLGLTRIGQLTGLPRSALERRFRPVVAVAPGSAGKGRRKGSGRTGRVAGGEAASLLLRLDRVRGLIADPLVPLREPVQFLVRSAFVEPLMSGEVVREAANRLVADLTRQLSEAERGARHITLVLDRVDGGCAEVRVGTSMPCRDPEHLMRLLGERLDGVDAGFGIDAMAVSADRVETLDGGRQSSMEARAGVARVAEERLFQLVDRLIGRFGPERVLVPTATESHLPERAGRLVPIVGSEPVLPAGPRPCGAARPAFLLAPPEPIDVLAEVPEGAPMRFTWRRAVRSVAKAEGPERIAPEWWLDVRRAGEGDAVSLHRWPGSAPRVRDYYRLEDVEGRGYWVFRDGLYRGEDVAERNEAAPKWFVHGVFA